MVYSLELLSTAVNEGYMPDIEGLAKKIDEPKLSIVGLDEVLKFIANYEPMWHEVGNQDLERQLETFKGKQPLYLDSEHTQRNPNLNHSDYLFVFKEFMKTWAARKNKGSPEENWYQMQEELADLIFESYR
ncbi:MAG: hypothetical protein Q7S56_01745 [Nanoarchaeota archaeon]|nr:hypothetical protein [Nanoarchaeota archaeon]